MRGREGGVNLIHDRLVCITAVCLSVSIVGNGVKTNSTGWNEKRDEKNENKNRTIVKNCKEYEGIFRKQKDIQIERDKDLLWIERECFQSSIVVFASLFE